MFFYHPEFGLFIFLLIPFLFTQFLLAYHRNKVLSTYTSTKLLSHLLMPRSHLLRWTKGIMWAMIWILICLALMQPYGNVRYPSLSNQSPSKTVTAQIIPREIIFLIDTSASMAIQDESEEQTRLEIAKEISKDVISQLQGQAISLFAFTSQLTNVVPPTLDYLFFRLSLGDLHINQGDIGGTAFAPILTALREESFPEKSEKHYTILLLSDGGDTQLENSSQANRKKIEDSILNALPDPNAFHLQLFAVGIGSLKPQKIPKVTYEGKPVFSQLQPDILKQLAHRGRGNYYQAENWTSWDLAQELIVRMNENKGFHSQKSQESQKTLNEGSEEMIVDDYYQIPLGLALLFYWLNLILPDVRRR